MSLKICRRAAKISGLFLAFIMALLLASCGNGTPLSNITSSPVQETSFPARDGEPSEIASYQAYYEKYAELASAHGEASLVEEGEGEYGSCSYLTGVCVVELIDFNMDGIEDLFVVFFNGEKTGENVEEREIPQTASYEIEIWTYVDGAMARLLHEPRVGSFLSFHTQYWNTDNCFFEVFENEDGLPVIQLYGDGGDGCSYTKLYHSGEAFARDELSFYGGAFTLNGSAISEDEWEDNICSYRKVLSAAYLSSDDSIAFELSEYNNIDYSATLTWTEKVIYALANALSCEKPAAEKEYLAPYLRELDRANREFLNETGSKIPYEYTLYDMDQNGVPELIIKFGTCEADYMYTVYTVINGKIVECETLNGSHSSLYVSGESGIVRYEGHMGSYEIFLYTLEGTTLVSQEIDAGFIDFDTEEGYPELDAYGFGGYDTYQWYGHTPAPVALFTYQ